MNCDRNPLSFTFPAKDFGHLAEKLDVLECHWSGVSEEKIRWIACWHAFDPCTLKCVHCGCCRKWDKQQSPSTAERANAALLLRLRAFFAANDQPTPWANFEDPNEADDEASVPIRVILAPVARLAAPVQLPVTPSQLPREPRQLTAAQLFGPMSEPAARALGATFAPDPDALVGDLESGCICIQQRRRATSVVELARLAGTVHSLCPVCNKKPAKKGLADRLTDAMAGKFPDVAAAVAYVPAGSGTIDEPRDALEHVIDRLSGVEPPAYAMTCPAVELIEVPAAAVEPAFEVDEGFE